MLFYSWAAAWIMGNQDYSTVPFFTPSLNKIVAEYRVYPVHTCVCINMHILVKSSNRSLTFGFKLNHEIANSIEEI